MVWAINIQNCICGTTCKQHATRPFVTRFFLLYFDMAPVELHKNGGGWACVVINTVFAHSISPNNKPSVSNNVMISWNDFANLKMSPANLISALTKAKSKPTSFPPMFAIWTLPNEVLKSQIIGAAKSKPELVKKNIPTNSRTYERHLSRSEQQNPNEVLEVVNVRSWSRR